MVRGLLRAFIIITFTMLERHVEWHFFRLLFHTDKKHDNLNGNTDHTLHSHKEESPTMSNNDKFETKKSFLILISIFSISLVAMFYVYLMFPELDE